LQNYAADEWDDEVAMQNKVTARAHAQMSGELNQQWLTQLATLTDNKQPYGAQISCATCHLGQAKPQSWAEDQGFLPDDFRLTDVYNEEISEDIDILNVNARNDISLDTVQYQQQVMYHMNSAMNVGCTHCHNSRYFPSWEVPAKYYSLNMVQMNQYIWQNWSEEWLGGQEPSCTLCHNGAVIPPGAVQSVDLMPAAISSFPDGLPEEGVEMGMSD
jgi:photosynthetic reaction center cytochrome c subunit